MMLRGAHSFGERNTITPACGAIFTTMCFAKAPVLMKLWAS